MSQKSIVFIVSALLSLFVSATAFAQSGGECGSDADCADGEICEIYATTDCACAPCAPGEECESCDCGGSGDFGACVTPPPTCDTDADCPSHLSCVSGWEDSPSAAPPCTVDPDGNEECAEPEPMPEPEPVQPIAHLSLTNAQATRTAPTASPARPTPTPRVISPAKKARTATTAAIRPT
jgi:hypothetical protein